MATDQVQASPDMSADSACLSEPLVTVKEQESGNEANASQDSSGFQPISMVLEWDSKSACEVRNEPGHFEPVSMVFELEGNELFGDPEPKLQPPLVYILNHEKFTTHKERKGSAKDVEALNRTFKNLQCRVEVVENPTTVVVNETIGELEKKDFGPMSGLVIIILSHGNRNDAIVACDNNTYNLNDHILNPICKIETLRGKPKILIVQACKGNLQADAMPEEYGHYIKCYCTSEGYEGYRDPDLGSIYIQLLCEAMDRDALTKDFTAIIKDVNVKAEEESKRRGKKQVPSTEGKLQPFCFGDYVINNKKKETSVL